MVDIDLFVNHEVDEPLFVPRILEIGWDKGETDEEEVGKETSANVDLNTDEHGNLEAEDENMVDVEGEGAQNINIGMQCSHANLHSVVGSNRTEQTHETAQLTSKIVE